MVLGPDPAGELAQEHFLSFLENFQLSRATTDSSSQVETPISPYVEQLNDLRNADRTTLNVDFEHVMSYDHLLATDVIRNDYYRFEPFLRKAVKAFVRNHMPAYVEEEVGEKEFWISFRNLPDTCHLRDLKTEKIGKLVSVSGTVTRTSEVRPELLLGKFSCLICGSEVKDVEQQFKFTQPTVCPNAACGNRDKWTLIMHDCKFVDWQRLRIQENSDEVPAGSLPRSLDIVLRNDIVEMARAGDKLVFTGTLIAVPDTAALSTPGDRTEARNAGARGTRSTAAAGEGVTGLKALGVRDLNYRLVFLASAVQPAGQRLGLANIRPDNDDELDSINLSPEEMEEVWQMKEHPRLYEQLLSSIAPAVYGHIEIKKAVLLMLMGGVHKDTPEGGSLRGDINVLIVGDPSCAKSQFLKYVASFLPRTVYTSGKSSSAAGLTATVAKEPETGEFCIEAGALMLADNGICCIDEFDKMDITDQVAIHEAMEQQTISIAKAGIQATLNARTSILAAANPSGGRYDRSKSLKYNLALPPAIMSRFDLIYIMIDEPDDVSDYNIAKHIVGVHQHGDDAIEPEFSKEQLQRYIRYARSIKPRFSEGAQQAVIDNYVKLRNRDATPGQKTAYRITVRQLEAMVRLSEALARLRCEKVVRPQHVMEASRLLQTSIISVDSHDIELDDEEIPEKYELLDAEQDAGQEEQELAGDMPGPAGSTEGESSQRKKAPTVSYEKFQKVRDMLIHKLQEVDGEGLEGDKQAGVKQLELIRWYIDEISQKTAMGSKELADEYLLTQRIIQHLIKKEGTLIVISSPEEEEEDGGFASESQERSLQLLDARILAVNPNFVSE